MFFELSAYLLLLPDQLGQRLPLETRPYDHVPSPNPMLPFGPYATSTFKLFLILRGRKNRAVFES